LHHYAMLQKFTQNDRLFMEPIAILA
jgi:hypothetical protein